MNDTHRPYQRCTNCVMDTSDSAITFDEHGVCDFCNDFYQNIQRKIFQKAGRDLLQTGLFKLPVY